MGSEPKDRAMTDEARKARAAYYRSRAADARAKAEVMSDIEAKTTMMQVAAMWDLMAENAAKNSPRSN
jgi:hypothetical protein